MAFPGGLEVYNVLLDNDHWRQLTIVEVSVMTKTI